MADQATPTPAQANTVAVDGTKNDQTPAVVAAAIPAENPVEAPAKVAEPASPALTKEAKAPDKDAVGTAEDFVLELPDNAKLKSEDVDKIASLAKEHGLSKDAAQALVEHENAMVAAREQEQLDHLKAQSDAWKQEVLIDKEMGGDNAAENVELAHRFAKTYWDDSFLEELEKTGLGNHPGLMKGFFRAGKAMAPDKLRGTGNPTGVRKKSLEESFYGKQEGA
jgi:hypothetical protein